MMTGICELVTKPKLAFLQLLQEKAHTFSLASAILIDSQHLLKYFRSLCNMADLTKFLSVVLPDLFRYFQQVNT